MADNEKKTRGLSRGDRMKAIKAALWDSKYTEGLKKVAAASGADVEHYTIQLQNACAANQKVLDADTASLRKALFESVSLGLPIGGVLGYGYVVPYSGAVSFQAGYLGMLHLCYNDGRCIRAAAEVVRERDSIEYIMGTNPDLRHWIPWDSDPREEIKGAYAIVNTQAGIPFVSVWPIKYLLAHRDEHVQRTRTGDFPSDSLVVTDFPMWCRKTVLRSVLKFVPLSTVAREVLQREEYIEAGKPIPALQSGDDVPLDDVKKLVTAAAPIMAE